MNCKFCGNFVPEGKDSCPVCGRRPEEEAVGKLLSENQPGAVAKQDEAAETTAAKPKKHPKGLFTPLVMIAASVGAWVYGVMNDVFMKLKDIFGISVEQGYIKDESSSFVPGGTAIDNSNNLMISAVIIGLTVLATILGIWGIVILCKRLYNRVKYSD